MCWMDEKVHSYTMISSLMSNMTLNYWIIVERYPKPNGVVGGSIPNFEIFSLLLTEKTKLASRWLYASYIPNKEKKR